MTRLLMLVEGQSEEIFAKRVLQPHLAEYGVFLADPVVLWTKRMPSGGGFRGGVCRWEQILKSLRPLLRDTDAWITTLIDYYGLPDDVPGYQASLELADKRLAILQLQEELTRQLAHPQLIPFLALHEFESWLFADPDVTATHFGQTEKAAQLANAGEPELINHGRHTHPKARLSSLFPSYRETADGPIVLEKIGIARIKAACPHFAAWMTRLEGLAQNEAPQ